MNQNINIWTLINATAGIAALTLTLTGCDTRDNAGNNRTSDTSMTRSNTDTRDSAVDTSTSNQQQPGTAPSPSSMDDSNTSRNMDTEGSDTSSGSSGQ